MRPANYFHTKRKEIEAASKNGRHELLAMPISSLMDQLRHEKIEVDQQKKLSVGSSNRQDSVRTITPALGGSRLWVDKYAPRQFMDLLSDQQTNRLVLTWLKSWDDCVFGKPTTRPKPESKLLPKSLTPKKSPNTKFSAFAVTLLPFSTSMSPSSLIFCLFVCLFLGQGCLRPPRQEDPPH